MAKRLGRSQCRALRGRVTERELVRRLSEEPRGHRCSDGGNVRTDHEKIISRNVRLVPRT